MLPVTTNFKPFSICELNQKGPDSLVGAECERRLWLGRGLMLGGFHLVLQASGWDGCSFDTCTLE